MNRPGPEGDGRAERRSVRTRPLDVKIEERSWPSSPQLPRFPARGPGLRRHGRGCDQRRAIRRDERQGQDCCGFHEGKAKLPPFWTMSFMEKGLGMIT